MVDCDYFTQFNKQLVIEPQRILLDYKQCDYTLEIVFPYSGCRRIEKHNSMNFMKVTMPKLYDQKIPIKAVYGIIDMQVNSYLVVVEKASVIGQIYHRKIFIVHKLEFVCLSVKQDLKDLSYVNGVKNLLSNGHLYFSDDYDLTNSLQKFISLNCSIRNKRKQYLFNQDWIDEFIKVKAYEWITGFISGFISINFTPGVNNSCELALISRRNKRRQGRRFITRGCDLDGNTANTIQTEVILQIQASQKEIIMAYVQLRGSLPFSWSQSPDMKWAPSVNIHSNDKFNSELMMKNYESIKKDYQHCTLINLIDNQGSQQKLGKYFQKLHNQIDIADMKLIWFDFHHECKKMKYENLSKLLDMVEKTIHNYGYFHMEIQNKSYEHSSKKKSQKGILRTNCMDCLDRTNVVQSIFSRYFLVEWLSQFKIMTKPRNISAMQKLPDNIEEIFRQQWTQNADKLSILYSGTPAMKTDFTATGKRTMKGSIKDGFNGARRYFLGNFYDSRSQDYIDFSLGKLKPRRNEVDRIKHSSCNSLFCLVILIILIPFLVHAQLGQSSIFYSIGGTILLIGLIAKLTQMTSSIFIRKPIMSSNRQQAY